MAMHVTAATVAAAACQLTESFHRKLVQMKVTTLNMVARWKFTSKKTIACSWELSIWHFRELCSVFCLFFGKLLAINWKVIEGFVVLLYNNTIIGDFSTRHENKSNCNILIMSEITTKFIIIIFCLLKLLSQTWFATLKIFYLCTRKSKYFWQK